MKKLATDAGIPYQMEILPRGGTDAGGLQMAHDGAAVITLSIPTRYVHSVIETAHKADIEATIALLAAFLEKAGDIDLST
jgi:putative aminopeptidase FrvX